MKPPNDPAGELVIAVMKGAASVAIPVAGGIAAEVANVLFNPIEKRKHVWMNYVADAISEIQNRFELLPGQLADDEKFTSVLFQASAIAYKTHQREKLSALRNSLVSTISIQSIDEDLIFQFIRFTDELSPTHVKILANLYIHEAQFSAYRGLTQVHEALQQHMGAPLETSIFRSFLHDLDSRFLIRTGDVDDLPEFATNFLTTEANNPVKVTPFGFQFLEFIGANKL